MIRFENTEVCGIKAAFRGMRNPFDSWQHSDSYDCKDPVLRCKQRDNGTEEVQCNEMKGYCIGKNDMKLSMALANSGSDHRKYLRMIVVYVDITAPFYWWKEFDTYKIGTVANSCSTMHTIHKRELTANDFSHEHLYGTADETLMHTVETLNRYIRLYKAADSSMEKKDYWWQIIQLLPTSFNQRRTVMVNYEVLRNINKGRDGHKLDEWKCFRKWIEALPYSELITGVEKHA